MVTIMQSIAGVVVFLAVIVLVSWLVDNGPGKLIDRIRKGRKS